ncbi:MAG: CAP domain-containing protein [Planctomycetota bacterium]
MHTRVLVLAAALWGATRVPASAQEPSPRQELREREQALGAEDAAARLALARFALEHRLEQDAARLLIEVCGLADEDARSAAVHLLSKTLDYHLSDQGEWQPPEVWYPQQGYVRTKRGWERPEDVELAELQRLWAEEVLELVNAVRKEHDLRPLKRDAKAERAATDHALDMAERGYFSHQAPEGTTLGQRCEAARVKHYGVGENIARGQPTPQAVMEAWMNSPGHRENLLKAKWTKLGVGLARGTDERGRTQLTWVQVFVNSKKPRR